MRAAAVLGVIGLLASAALAAPPEGPPYYDRKRGLEAQEEAGRAAAESARTLAEAKGLVALLLDESAIVRDRVFGVLAARDDEAALTALLPHLGHDDEFVSAAVAELIGQRRWAAGREALEKVGLAQGELTALESIWALERLGEAASRDALERAFKRRREHRVKGDALIALAALAPEAARPLVEGALEKEAPPVRIAALVALRAIEPAAAAAAAVDVVAAPPLDRKDRPWEPRLLFAALESLRLFTARAAARDLVVRAVDALIDRLAREEGLALHEVGAALQDLTGAEGLEPDAQVWRGWWSARREAFQPQDKAPPPPAPKPRRGRAGDAPPDEPDAPDARGPVTGDDRTSKVRFHGIPVRSKRLLFAQDMSGGMNNPLRKDDAASPTKLKFSKDELVRVLRALPDDTHTNVVFFASEFWRHADRLVPLGRARAPLVGFVEEAVTPGRGLGRSNLYDALAFALADPEIDTVFFLSEGGPNEGRWVERERFMRHVVRLNVYQRVQVHTLQVTNNRPGAAFLRRLAEETGGRFYGVEELEAARR
jgi:hypothetical protein